MTYIGTTPNYGTLHSQTITTANGSTATFTLDQYVADADSIIVTIGNVVQEPVTAYTASGNSITFTENVPNGDTIVIRYLGRQIDVPTSYTQSTRYKYVATNNQTTFSGADANSLTLSYTVGNIDCYLNGVHLDESDFTATNGTSVVLGSGATTSDELVIVAWKTVQISNALDKTAGGTITGALIANSTLDMNGTELILDADGDSSIHSSTDDQIDIKVGNVDKVIVTGNGDVSIGGNTPNTYSGWTALTIGGSASTTGSTIDFEDSDGNRDAQVYADANYLYLSNTDVKVETGNLVIGTAGKGIDFSATADGSGSSINETLTDYEHGVWTPTAQGGQTIGSISSAFYQKIGQMVYVGTYFTLSAIPNNAGMFYFGGLPFAVATGSHYHAAGSITYVAAQNIQSIGMMSPTPYSGGGTTFYFHRANGSSSTVANSEVQGMTSLILGFWYYTTA